MVAEKTEREERERRGRADLRKDLNSGKMGKNAEYIRRERERERLFVFLALPLI